MYRTRIILIRNAENTQIQLQILETLPIIIFVHPEIRAKALGQGIGE